MFTFFHLGSYRGSLGSFRVSCENPRPNSRIKINERKGSNCQGQKIIASNSTSIDTYKQDNKIHNLKVNRTLEKLP